MSARRGPAPVGGPSSAVRSVKVVRVRRALDTRIRKSSRIESTTCTSASRAIRPARSLKRPWTSGRVLREQLLELVDDHQGVVVRVSATGPRRPTSDVRIMSAREQLHRFDVSCHLAGHRLAECSERSVARVCSGQFASRVGRLG